MSSEVMKILMDYSEKSGKRDSSLRVIVNYDWDKEMNRYLVKKKKKTVSKKTKYEKRYR